MIAEGYSAILFLLSIWTVVISIYIVSERRTPAATVAWVLSLSFLPFIGFAVYFFLGPRRFDRKKKRRLQSLKAVYQKNSDLSNAPSIDIDSVGFLIAGNVGAAGPSAMLRQADIEVFFSGQQNYARLLQDIDQAKSSINMEYYIWEPDTIGTRIRDALVKKAQQGILIHLHLDGIGSAKANRRFWRPLLQAGGQVVYFNRFVLRRRSGNFRTHRKIVVIDGRIGYCGGMNIAELHSEEFLGDKAWRDTHLRLEGPAVRGLQMVFNEGWHDTANELLEGPKYCPSIAPQGEHQVQVVSSGPDEDRNAIHKLFASAIFSSHQRVYWSIPYFVPDSTTFDALTTASLRGVDVRILVPKDNDLKLIGAASRSYYPQLLKMGVRIFEYKPAMLHAKTLVVDQSMAVVGTANADNRSFRLNFEVAVASFQGPLCETLVDAFQQDLKSADEVTTDTIANYGKLRRLGQSFARLISNLV